MDKQTLAYLKRITEQYMTETCTIQKRMPKVNAVGAAVEEFEDTATVKCRIITERQGAHGSAEQIAGRETLTDSYRFALPAGTEIRDDYRLIANGFTHEIIGILDKHTDGNEVQVRARRMR
mgnify:CR=1 FL=1